jgi:single-stranded-DNA-specific exonuclease
VTKARAETGLRVDAALTANAATPDLIHRLEAAGPFGAGAPEPMFALPRHRLAEVTPVGVEGRHLRLRAVAGDGRAVEGIAFRASGKKLGEALIRLRGAPVHLAGTLSVNRFGGRERAQIRVVDVAEATQ